jgi:hypothetical protein
VLKNGSVYLVKMLLRGCNIAVTTVKNCIQSLKREALLSLTDEPAGRCSPNEETTSTYNQLSENLLAWPAISKCPFSPEFL